MKRTDMVRSGATQLITAENAIEMALSETTGLASHLGRMRIDGRLSMVIGQEAMGAIVEAITALSNARGAMIKAHAHLDDVKTQLGCKTMAMGTLLDKPQARTDLSIVASEQNAA